MRVQAVFRVLFPAILVVLLGSCARLVAPVLEQNELFSLSYGTMEDEVELLLDGGAVDRKTSIVMRNGLFYVGSGYGNRIMEFTSFGDLLTLYYNPDQNPRPVMLEDSTLPNQATNRRAFAHSFNNVGEIAVNSQNMLIVEDQVPDRVSQFDDELGVRLNRVLVRFDSDGQQTDYIGQEGVGGTYFPYIQQMMVTANDDIVVVAVAPPRVIVFWYDSEGVLLRKLEMTNDDLPVAADMNARPLLESVYPDQNLRRLYVKVNYYLLGQDDTGFGRLMSRVYWIDMATGEYDGFVEVPRNTRQDSVFGSSDEEEFYYELVGTASGEHLFLLSQESTTETQLLILQTSGQVVRRRTLQIDYDEVLIRELHLSHTGILSALLATPDSVDVVWWRTDRLFDAGVQ
jgi:hypothetical protein